MIFMVLSSWQSHCESSPGSFDECRLSAEVAANSQTKPTVNQPERNGSYHPHPPSSFIITQPDIWYLFYRPMEGGRLSRPRHCSKGVLPVPKAVYRSGCHDKELPAVRFEPRSSHTTVRHATTRPPRLCSWRLQQRRGGLSAIPCLRRLTTLRCDNCSDS